ncbi:metacaspase [Anaeromyces robustus]|uniref:Metacaspase n=1 Tax=Anaeromyces robustus TaxID=1754192 RepID=A0A1Y1WUU0_9FUNG|nr:metacaspase [Anaeromyces robustus]|eukprot:ORX77058.1 metacaspase [Anaeromyces robustus]
MNNSGSQQAQDFNRAVHRKIREQNLWNRDVDRFYREKGGDRCVRSTCDGNKKALFIGINYKGTSAELKGCINDITNVSELFCRRFGFNNCLYLTDEQNDPNKKPTYNNIIDGMKWLVQGARPGDSLFFHYSGHGGTAKDKDNDEVDGFDETILPLDYQTAGQIIDDVIYENLVTPLPQGCRLTAIFDSCHSGTVLDLPYTYQCDGQIEVIENDMRKEMFKKAMDVVGSFIQGDQTKIASALLGLFDGSLSLNSSSGTNNQQTIQKRRHDADVIQFSGCMDNQTSADAKINNVSTGAMSYAMVSLLSQNKDFTYAELLTGIRQIMKQKKFSQIPQLSTSHPMNMNEKFIM